MQPYIIVLAGNTREGRRYAKLAGLPRGRHRVVFSAKQIRHLRSAEIHELPSFKRRPDRHGINAALRYTRGERKQVTMPTTDTPMGPTHRQLQVAYRYNALLNTQELGSEEPLSQEELKSVRHQVAEERKPDFNGDAMISEGDPVDQGDGLGEQLTIDGGQVQVPEPAKPRRRKRCAVCQELVTGDDDPSHDADAHEANDSKVLGKPAPPSSLFGG